MELKKEFPFLHKFPNFIYADSAATSLKPSIVIDAIKTGYTYHTLPAGKSIYKQAEETFNATEIATKNKIITLLKIKDHEIFFGYSVTVLFDRLFFLLKKKFAEEDNINILLPRTVHNAILFPIQTHFGIKAKFFFYKDGKELREKISSTTIVILPIIDHISGTFFLPEEIEILKNNFKEKIFILDGAQSFSFFPYPLCDSAIDFLLWSSHKMYGPDNIAVLIIKKESLFDIIEKNNCEQINSKKKIENFCKSGSFSYASLFAFQECLKWVEEKIYLAPHYLSRNKNFVTNIIKHIEKRNFTLLSDKNSLNIVSFTHETMHAHDIALLFSENNIGIRSGELCSSTYCIERGISRISMGCYLNEEDIDLIQQVIAKI
jgi:selenocysteine lyase/cysteine desulfurase